MNQIVLQKDCEELMEDNEESFIFNDMGMDSNQKPKKLAANNDALSLFGAKLISLAD